LEGSEKEVLDRMSNEEASPRPSWVRRAAVEGPIIVVSILLAFAIDAGWDRWIARGELREILQGLEAEYVDHVELYEWRVDTHRRKLEALTLLMSGPPALNTGVEALDNSIYRLLIVGTVDPGRGVRDALISSGRLELIPDTELRLRLATWESFVDEVHENQELMRRQVESAILPYLASQGVPLARTLSAGAPTSQLWPSDLVWPEQPTSTEGAEATYHRILSDPQFQSYLALNYTWLAWTVDELELALDEAVWILSSVRDHFGRP
jgi:hypothetical protein